MEHGLHQEFGWNRETDASGVAFLVYTDTVDNPYRGGRTDDRRGRDINRCAL